MKLETNNYILTVKEKKILVRNTEWLNDTTMGSAQKLICKALVRLESYQPVLNKQKKGTFFSVLVRRIFTSYTTVQTIDLCHLALTTTQANTIFAGPGIWVVFK